MYLGVSRDLGVSSNRKTTVQDVDKMYRNGVTEVSLIYLSQKRYILKLSRYFLFFAQAQIKHAQIKA